MIVYSPFVVSPSCHYASSQMPFHSKYSRADNPSSEDIAFTRPSGERRHHDLFQLRFPVSTSRYSSERNREKHSSTKVTAALIESTLWTPGTEGADDDIVTARYSSLGNSTESQGTENNANWVEGCCSDHR